MMAVRLRVKALDARVDRISNSAFHSYGAIMQRAVSGPPWNYDDWPVGDKDSPPGPETATGYMKLCSHIVELVQLHDDGTQQAVGICAGMPLITDEVVHTVHLDHGVDAELVAKHVGADETAEVNRATDGYHLISALNHEVRSLRVDDESIARMMVDILFRAFRDGGVRRIWSKTHPAQHRMLGIYDKIGLPPVGEQVASHGAISAPRRMFMGLLENLKLKDHSQHVFLTDTGMIFGDDSSGNPQ